MKIKHLLFLLLTLTSTSSMAESYTLTQDFTASSSAPATTFTGEDGTKFSFSGNKLSSETSWGKGQYKFDKNTTIELTWAVAEGKSIVITAFSVTGAAGRDNTWFLYTNLDGKTDDCSKKGTSDQTLPLPETWAKKLRKGDKIIVQASGSSAQYIKGFSITYEIIDLNAFNQDIPNVIVNPSFETGNLTGWTIPKNSDDTGVKENNGVYTTEGCDGNYLFNTWWQGVPLTQTIANIPNGKYTLTVSLASGDDAADAKLYLLAQGNYSEVITRAAGSKGLFSDASFDFEVTDGTATIGVVGGNADGTYNENGHWWYKADNFRLTLVAPEVKATMAVNSTAKYGTFCAPFAVEIPDGVTAYTVSGVEGNALVMNKVTTTIPANTPVILNAEEGLAATSFYGLAVEGTPTVGALTGVYTATPAENGWYVLQNNAEGVGFYKVDTETAIPTVGANRCYMTVRESEAAPRAFFFGGETTAIETISALVNNEVKEIYNANGVKQNSLQKGMNIIKMSDGSVKKIMVK